MNKHLTWSRVTRHWTAPAAETCWPPVGQRTMVVRSLGRRWQLRGFPRFNGWKAFHRLAAYNAIHGLSFTVKCLWLNFVSQKSQPCHSGFSGGHQWNWALSSAWHWRMITANVCHFRSYQYLTNVTSWQISNGPRFTNASYDGLTADGAVRVKREVSSWATRDIARHLHSFRYEVLRTAGWYC